MQKKLRKAFLLEESTETQKFRMSKRITLPPAYVEKCRKGLFMPIEPDTVQCFLLMRNGKPLKLVEVSSLNELLLASIPKQDRSAFEGWSDLQIRKYFLELVTSAGSSEIIPVRVSPASYELMTILGLVDSEEIDLEPLFEKTVAKFKLNANQKKELRKYATTAEIYEDLLSKKRSVVLNILSTELEDVEEDLLEPKPWLEIHKLFVNVWAEEQDEDERKKVYRNLGYTKNPKKTPEENKKVLINKFKKLYEELDKDMKIVLGDYLESDDANVQRAVKILLGRSQ